MNKKITELEEAEQVSNNDLLVIVQGGKNKKIKFGQMTSTRKHTIKTTSTIIANTDYELPVTYRVGSENLEIYVEGVLLTKGQHYVEVGTNGDRSKIVQFGFEIKKESVITVKMIGNGNYLNSSDEVVINTLIDLPQGSSLSEYLQCDGTTKVVKVSKVTINGNVLTSLEYTVNKIIYEQKIDYVWTEIEGQPVQIGEYRAKSVTIKVNGSYLGTTTISLKNQTPFRIIGPTYRKDQETNVELINGYKYARDLTIDFAGTATLKYETAEGTSIREFTSGEKLAEAGKYVLTIVAREETYEVSFEISKLFDVIISDETGKTEYDNDNGYFQCNGFAKIEFSAEDMESITKISITGKNGNYYYDRETDGIKNEGLVFEISKTGIYNMEITDEYGKVVVLGQNNIQIRVRGSALANS